MNEITTTSAEPASQVASSNIPQTSSAAPDWSRRALEELHFGRHPSGGLGFKIRNRWVMKHTFHEAWGLFWAGVPTLAAGRIHKAKNLACTPDWGDRPKGERIAMGRCFRYFAEHRILPLTLLNPEKKSNLKYRLNPGLEPTPTTH